MRDGAKFTAVTLIMSPGKENLQLLTQSKKKLFFL
jgi:hypothetical protein